MGELDEGNNSESYTLGEKRNSKLITAIMLLLGLFAPLVIYVFSYVWMTPQISILSIFWMYSSESYYMYSFFGFSLVPLYSLFIMFPIVLLRMVPVSQIYRYYNGKTTRRRAFIASCIGDGLFLIYGTPYLFLGFWGMLMLPLPFQLIFGFLVLWRYPIPEPTTPWKITSDDSEPKSWWEKSSDPQQKKPADSEAEQKKPTDNDDVLW